MWDSSQNNTRCTNDVVPVQSIDMRLISASNSDSRLRNALRDPKDKAQEEHNLPVVEQRWVGES
jgi:hypothetical protein